MKIREDRRAAERKAVSQKIEGGDDILPRARYVSYTLHIDIYVVVCILYIWTYMDILVAT